MERLNNSYPWLKLALWALAATLLFGFLAAIRYQTGAWLDDYLSFRKLRPLHVSSALGWIFASAIGLVLYANRRVVRGSEKAMLPLYVVTGSAILISYVMGIFGGREYWEFSPWLIPPILMVWLLFGKAVLRRLKFSGTAVPVYRWMWLTGLLFFAFTFLESLLWHLPAIHSQPVRETALQWKSYGSLVGSWNMLIYGSAAWLGRKLQNKRESAADSWQEGALYLLSLTNLMFNWSHHIYDLPVPHWILQLGFYISMSELLVLYLLLRSFKLSSDKRPAARLLQYSELWVIINLVPAILMSVPWLNQYTHGTHVTVAHAMGTTIGINTMILLAGIAWHACWVSDARTTGRLLALQVLLFLFVASLFATGVYAGLIRQDYTAFQLRQIIQPFLTIAMWLGMGTAVAFVPIWLQLYRGLNNPTELNRAKTAVKEVEWNEVVH
ncbi:MAG: cbb3-type cytochrome c oxidase subunit I [Bacteroidia bacterium]